MHLPVALGRRNPEGITMYGEFTRKELYDLVWSQPMKTLAAGVGISDVALAKQCAKANISGVLGTETSRKADNPDRPTTAVSRCLGQNWWLSSSILHLELCQRRPCPALETTV
jgi:hypothetical protein